ncbi:MAG TPA: YjfB family protein [Azospira sp.]|nr:YjfB family protein [Azospira sp.]
MDTSAVAGAASALSSRPAGDAVSTLVLKKALDIQAQNAAQLIQSLPQPQYNNPPNLGQGVDVFA